MSAKQHIQWVFTIMALFSFLIGKAQDPQLSQFYAAPLYLSPSFAGATNKSRLAANYRNQWPAIPGAFVTYICSYDQYFPNLNSGMGVVFMKDRSGSGGLATTQAGFVYSYNVKINEKLQARPGLSILYAQRSIDINKLTLGDQLYWGTSSSLDQSFVLDKVAYPDFNVSALLYSERYWFGAALDHLTTPNQSLWDNGAPSPVYRKFTAYGGTNLKIKRLGKKDEGESVTVTFIYKHQHEYDQLDLGLYWHKTPLVVGLWYRGLPVLKAYQPGYGNNDALIFLAGMKFKDFQIGYSFDFTISRMVGYSGGAHELSMTYTFKPPKKQKKLSDVPCPTF
ncbi:MAG: type IX secretion system membrane protein PorP/SprF [Bacteroidetes bacterium]|nr:type IX secretion system membrane protein PorP/SprF [Bacteroidota bacterium]